MGDRTLEQPRGLAIGEIPEMTRLVCVHGALRQTEVGGSVCFGVVVTAAVTRSAER